MKQLILLSLSSIFILQVNNQFAFLGKPVVSAIENKNEVKEISFQDEGGRGKMSAIAFKSQKFCRAEPDENFEFDVRFSVISANVYFSGANFRNTERGAIKSSDLKPIESLMQRCIPGSIVVFDDIKVKGPDNVVRTIQGLTLILY